MAEHAFWVEPISNGTAVYCPDGDYFGFIVISGQMTRKRRKRLAESLDFLHDQWRKAHDQPPLRHGRY